MLRILIIICLFFVTSASAEEIKSGDYYVSANQLSVRSAPNTAATVTNTLDRKQIVEVFEVKDGWARISNFNDASAQGKSVKTARWVSVDYLTATEPIGVLAEDTDIERYIRNSDNYSQHKSSFIDVSKKLLEKGRCNLSDYKNIGGWVSSMSHKSKPIYFTYCGGFSKSNKIYINAKSGQILN